MAQAIVFDVNGTLLDGRHLEPAIRRIFGKKLSARVFFDRVLLYSMAETLAGEYQPLNRLVTSVLAMEAEALGIRMSTQAADKVLMALQSMPPFLDVRKGLKQLQADDYRLAVLTNSPPATLQPLLERAQLAPFFDRQFSVDAVRQFKPAQETYGQVVRNLGLPAEEILFVAAHSWDLLGASKAGMKTAFLRRPGMGLLERRHRPEYVADSVLELARTLRREKKPRRWWQFGR